MMNVICARYRGTDLSMPARHMTVIVAIEWVAIEWLCANAIKRWGKWVLETAIACSEPIQTRRQHGTNRIESAS
jgi:hypothetical protein